MVACTLDVFWGVDDWLANWFSAGGWGEGADLDVEQAIETAIKTVRITDQCSTRFVMDNFKGFIKLVKGSTLPPLA